jgi:hypothetical protein
MVMEQGYSFIQGGAASEMAIVDTFTKLIFGEEGDFGSNELLIIQALRAVDNNVTLDDHHAMGEYLSALGVREMIQLVSQVREQLAAGMAVPTRDGSEQVQDRRPH